LTQRFAACEIDDMLRTLAISGYRSLRDVRVELGALNVVTGPKGSGKSSLYRALRLLAEAAPSLRDRGGSTLDRIAAS
jgi:predicted ATPase